METATKATGSPFTSQFRWQPPPLAVRCLISFFILGFLAPMMWVFDKLGVAERVMRSGDERQKKKKEGKNPFRGYIPTCHDVFVATYAKSGTNWMMQIAHQLLFHGKGEFDHIHCVVPWPDTRDMGAMVKFAIPLEDDSVWRASPEKKRVIKTHLNWENLPYSKDARYIIVIRDPKDVFVSNYFFLRQVYGPAQPPVRTWLNLFLSGNLGGSWAVNAAGSWAERHRPNVLVVSFKSMKHDLRGTVLQVADFLDVCVTEDIVDAVCEKSSFDYMKRNDDKFRMWPLHPWGNGVGMVRKGTQGGSSEILSAAEQREVDAHFVDELKRLGSDLAYEEFADVTK